MIQLPSGLLVPSDFRSGGFFDFEVLDRAGGRVLRRGRSKNGVCLAGLTDLLSQAFAAGTQRTAWYCGLINNTPTPTLSSSDTLSSNSWDELGTSSSNAYAETTRRQWSPTVTNQSASNATVMSFTANATIAAYGAFIATDNTKGGTSGILWATAAFSSVQNLVSGNVLRVTYTLTASGS